MKIKILNHEIELTNKVNLFIPSDDLCEEGLELFYLDLSNNKNTNFVQLSKKEYKSLNNQKEYFLHSFHNKEKLNSPNLKLWVYTTNPVYILWLPEDSCVWKVGKEEIKKFDIEFISQHTLNTLVESEIFELNSCYPEIYKNNPEKYKGVYLNSEFKEECDELSKKANEAIEKAKQILGDRFYK